MMKTRVVTELVLTVDVVDSARVDVQLTASTTPTWALVLNPKGEATLRLIPDAPSEPVALAYALEGLAAKLRRAHEKHQAWVKQELGEGALDDDTHPCRARS